MKILFTIVCAPLILATALYKTKRDWKYRNAWGGKYNRGLVAFFVKKWKWQRAVLHLKMRSWLIDMGLI